MWFDQKKEKNLMPSKAEIQESAPVWQASSKALGWKAPREIRAGVRKDSVRSSMGWRRDSKGINRRISKDSHSKGIQ